MVHGSAIHHAEKIIELIVMPRIDVCDVVVNEELAVRSDESVGVLGRGGCQ